ncbi:TPA: type-F conjugative transfer system pilin assembly protein TraF [Legionella pneumophila]|nr:type-F conjugative transfer system pilin assembly protein TraF [Legionella pneumophila]
MARWFFVLLVSVSPFLYAEQPYLNEHEEGWYWHKDPKEEVKNKPQTESVAASPVSKPADPDKTWKLIGNRVQQARAQAILNPTPENIARARRLQRLIVAQANLFSEKWMLDLLINPDQDESLINPSSSAARDVYNQKNSMQKEKAITQISQTSGLLYFYEGGEPFSERMAQVVSDFANSYHMTVIPIAMTNRISPMLPNSRVDSGQATQMGVKHIPAVFALNPVSKKTMPVAYGLVSQSELKENILMASNAFQSGDYNAQ